MKEFAGGANRVAAKGHHRSMRRLRCIYALVLLVASALSLVLAEGSVAHEASDSNPGAVARDGRLPGVPDVRHLGMATYRYLPAQEVYEKRMPGKPPVFMHVDRWPKRINAEYKQAPDNGVWVGSLRPPCRTASTPFKNRTVVVYAYSADQASTVATANKEIRRHISEINWTFHHEALLASGETRELQVVVDCDSAGKVLVHDVETDATEPWEVELDVELDLYGHAGDYGTGVKYLVYNNNHALENGGYAGIAYDARKTNENYNNDTSVAMASSDGLESGCNCSPDTPIHELIHAMGGTQGGQSRANPPAPYSWDVTHCYDRTDVMCANYPTAPAEIEPCKKEENQEQLRRWRIDCGNDTYFNPVAVSTAPNSWLAKYWNLAEPENPYLVEAAEATTEAVGQVTGESAELRGAVNPRNHSTVYQFEYGMSKNYGSTLPTVAKSAGSGSSAIAVSERVNGLSQNTTYHYRLVATSQEATVYGEDREFKTGTVTPPGVSTGSASGVIPKGARLNATVNPNGGETTYYFRYGKEPASYVSTAKQTLPAGTTAVSASADVAGLDPSTSYQFRVVAENKAGKSEGADSTFTTLPSVALCKISESPCLQANRYKAGTAVSASLQAGTTFALKANSGTLLNSCTGSSLQGAVTAAGGPNETASAEISTASFSGCSGALSAEGLNWKAEILRSDGNSSGTVNFANLSIKSAMLGTTCGYGGKVPFSFISGTEAQMVASSTPMSRLSGGFVCPETVNLTATYIVKAPAPLYLAAYPLGNTVLCNISSEVCPEANRYKAGTAVSASLKAGTTFALKASSGSLLNSCTGSTLGGALTATGSTTEVPTADISAASFSGCGGSTLGEGFSWHSEIARTSGTSGTATFYNLAIKSAMLGTTCGYGGKVPLTLSGGSPAQLLASSTPLSKVSGGFLCPATAFLTATYDVTAPAPLYVSRAG